MSTRHLFAIFLALVCLVAPESRAQNAEANAALQAAMAQINAGESAQGLAALEQLTAAYPEFQTGWSTLGSVKRRSGDLEGSLDAFKKAYEVSGASPSGLLNVGLAYAFLDRDDEAFDWLLRAKETGAVSMAVVDGSPAASNLRDDARYASLFPSESEFKDPFVEGNRIIQDWFGEGRGDTFGWIARNIGDVDGDGINDVTTSSPGFNQAAGKIYAYSSATGRELWSLEGTVSGGRLGHGIEAAGDVDADGVPDVVAFPVRIPPVPSGFR
jgi:type II secretory pathway pseudopilin PulG